MNPAQLLAHFDRISEAPDAIPRLRRFILDLAVRGKLVEQDPNDEPAGELLKRIKEKKTKRIKAGEIRSPRVIEWTDSIEQLFPVVNSWAWVRLADVGAIVGGGTPQSNDADNFTDGGTGIAWLTPTDLGKHNELYVSHGSRDITQKGLKSSSATLMPKDSVLFTSRAPIGYTAIAANEITTNQGFKSVIPYITECSRYIALYLKAFGPWIDSKASGTTFREVSGKIVSGLPIPLPPLAEQHRIVAKVDELMALCDQLEAAKKERESQRDRLIAASLHRLNSSDDADASRENARFYLNHLPRLTTRLEHIKQLRQTIFNLAVRGRLVPQDPNDEPIRNLRDIYQIDVESFYQLPSNWQWRTMQELADLVTDGEHATPTRISERQVPLITAKNVRDGMMDYAITDWVSYETAEKAWRRCQPLVGDILLVCVGATTGRLCVLREPKDMVLVRSVTLIRPSKIVNVNFLALVIRSPLGQGQIWSSVKATAQPCLYINRTNALVIPLPPLAEQHRIVAKVDELMTLCDQLETQLTTTQTDNHRLLEAVLHQALAENP